MLSTDVLSKATPTRLICRGGRWTLELTRLEAVDRDVFQPRLARLEGSESILAALRRSEDGQHLVAGAAHLMRGPRSDDDRAFEASDGDWVPSADASLAMRAQTARDSEAVAASRAIAELRAELAVLRASHARLRDRVVALEATQSGIAQPNLRAARGGRAARRRSEPPAAFTEAQATPEALASNPGFAATQASPGLPAAPAAGPPAAPPPAAGVPAGADGPPSPSPSFEELAKSFAGEQPLPALNLPTLASLSDCFAMLMGSAPALERSAVIAFDSLERAQVCKLLDDDGRERGAIMLDLKAAVMLGAALLTLPREEASRQVTENDPSEDALLATSEICNNLTGPINAVSGNVHVRSTALTALAETELMALPKPRERLDLLVEGGRVVLAMF
jgi:hypothetical protein